jgi:phosphoadenosine phosphosulfate reductase
MLVESIITENGIEVRDKVKVAIDRLKAFEPPEGYYLAFSGGKDSQCIYHLVKEAGVKFDAHYNVTGIDHPKLVYFIRKNYSDVAFEKYRISMWRLIEKNGPPTRLNRFCCRELKERGGKGRICVTGVRWAESVRRKNERTAFEYMGASKKSKILFNDNAEGRRQFENCTLKGKLIINPIIDWENSDVWDYLNSRNIEHCVLYDEGFDRLGCIGCPMSGTNGMNKEFEYYPRFKKLYEKAIARFLIKYLHRCEVKGKTPLYTTVVDWMDWWINGTDEDTQRYWMGKQKWRNMMQRIFNPSRLPALREEYRKLRETMSKNKSCETLAKKYYCSASLIWKLCITDVEVKNG